MKYKVGDKVRIKSIDWYNENKGADSCVHCGDRVFDNCMSVFCGSVVTIGGISLYGYDIREDLHCRTWTDEMFEELVEEEMSLDKAGQITDFEYEGLAYTLPEGYQFVDENGNVINTTKIVLEKKKKEYPKTFEECVHVLEGDSRMSLEQMNTFRKLIDSRNAYWKIAGEEMGLGKPWEPDWDAKDNHFYTIHTFNGKIECSATAHRNAVLIFPTEEMRDAFYENFKEEIEFVKELL